MVQLHSWISGFWITYFHTLFWPFDTVFILFSVQSPPPVVQEGVLKVAEAKEKRRQYLKNRRETKKLYQKIGFSTKPPWNYVYLPNGDPRYSYAKKIIDSINTGRREIVAAMAKDLFSPDIVYQHYYNGEVNPYGPKKLKLTGNLHFVCVIMMRMLCVLCV